jgi:hypothetical protein
LKVEVSRLQDPRHSAEGLQKWIEGGGFGYFDVDRTILDATSSLEYEALDDIALCREIDSLRFELAHLSRKLDLLLQLEYDPEAKRVVFAEGVGQTTSYQQMRPQLAGSILSHIPTITAVLESLTGKSPKAI